MNGGHTPEPQALDEHLLAILNTAASLRLDALAASIHAALGDRGIASVLLKGPSVANWLYDDGTTRPYSDADLLVSPGDWDAARATLSDLGFELGYDEFAHPRMGSVTSEAWVRGQDNLDLHCTLWGIESAPERVWDELAGDLEHMRVGGAELAVLSKPARAMHLALHVAQHGDPEWTTAEDLTRAVQRLPEAAWRQATELAERLQALPAFVSGLRMVPAGNALADALELGYPTSVAAALRSAGVPLAQGLDDFAHTRGIGAKLRVVRSEIVPSPTFMRWWLPLANRGRAGLAAAYVYRIGWIAWHLLPAYRTWRRARTQGNALVRG